MKSAAPPHFSMLQRKIVSVLLTHGPLPRVEVAARLDVSRSRLSPEVAQLLDKRAVREEPAPLSTGGRRGTWLHLGAGEFGVVAGVDIDAGVVSVALTYLDGTIVSRQIVDADSSAQPGTVLAAVGDVVEAELERVGATLRAAGVSIAADVDEFGKLTDPPPTMPQWVGIAVGEEFSERLAVPVRVDNDVNALAIAEGSRGGPACGHDTYAVVKVSSGVGCGLVINGALARGAHGYAGDIGHICIDPSDQTLCACGNKGCLETVVSAPALIRGAESLVRGGHSAVLASTANEHGRLSLALIGEAAQAEDPATTAMLRSAGRHVGFVIAGLVSIVNPEAVLISTGISGAEDLVLSAVRERVYERARPAATRGLHIGTCQLTRGDGALAAAALACRVLAR